MNTVRTTLINIFTKIMAKTVSREEGAMVLNHMAKQNKAVVLNELNFMIQNPPPNIFPITVLHTITLTRNRVFDNILIGGLEHGNEDISIFSARELAQMKTSDAKKTLAEHLDSNIYHVRKAAANALIESFAEEGIELLKSHILSGRGEFYRITSAEALLKAKRQGIDALLNLLCSGDSAAAATVADILRHAKDDIKEEDMNKLLQALKTAAEQKNAPTIIMLLTLIESLGEKAKSLEKYVQALIQYPFQPVRDSAEKAFKSVKISQ